MAGTPYLKYTYRGATQRSAGRYEYSEIWIVPDIQNTYGPLGQGDGQALSEQSTSTWQHEVLKAPGLPSIGAQNEDGSMVVVSLMPRSTEDQGTAMVEVRYQEDPLTLPTEVHYFTASKIKPAWSGYQTNVTGAVAADPITSPNVNPRDILGGDIWDIRNSANDRFNPPVTYEAPLERIEITTHRSLEWHDSFNWANYLKRWNDTSFAVVTKDPDKPSNNSTRTFSKIGTLFLADKRAPLVKDPYLHRVITLTFLYDPDTFGVRVADMGSRANFTAANKPSAWPAATWPTTGLCPVIDMYGWPYGGIAELDGNGKQLFPTTLTDPTTMPPAVVYAWWPVDYTGAAPLSCNFADFDIFTPENTLTI